MGEAGCAAVVVHGGDGTNRAAALGWPSIPVIPISTGTNNAFPINVEPTLAGAAAGLLATGAVSLDEVGVPVPVVHLELEGEGTDVAVVDAVLLAGGLVGSMLLFEPERLAGAVVARASSSSLGMCGLAGLLASPRSRPGLDRVRRGTRPRRAARTGRVRDGVGRASDEARPR